jgi:hypothetical protein
MMRLALSLALLCGATASHAECNTLDAVFENERASSVLKILATEAGFELVNPELATGRFDATFEDEDPARLLALIARDQGFTLRVDGRRVWLEPA